MSWFCGDNPCEKDNCPYDLRAPAFRSKEMNTAFSAYAFHQQQIEDFINLLAAADDPNDGEAQTELLYQVGLSPNDLTSYDIDYIEREVSARCL